MGLGATPGTRRACRGAPSCPANPPPSRRDPHGGVSPGSAAFSSVTDWSRRRVMTPLRQGVSVWKGGDSSRVTGLWYRLSEAMCVKRWKAKGAHALRGGRETARRQRGGGDPICAVWKQLCHLRGSHACQTSPDLGQKSRPDTKYCLGIWWNQEALHQPHHRSGPHPALMTGSPISPTPQPLLTLKLAVSVPASHRLTKTSERHPPAGTRGTHPLATTRPASHSPWPPSVPGCNPHLALGARGVLLARAVCDE